MKDTSTGPARSSWHQDDFIDAATAPPSEDDPWDPQHRPVFGLPPADAATKPSHTVSRAYTDAANDSDDDSSSNLLLLLEEAEGAETLDEPSVDDIEFSRFDEPQPELSATSVLRDDLYPPDHSINNFTLELKLDSLLATLALEPAELDACRTILKSESYDISRLRKLLPWLAAQQWSAGSLLLFLEFRRTWESPCNVRWWEWHYGPYPFYDYHTLTWIATYDLVHHRSHCRPNEVIDESWFHDWEEFEIWRHGVISFAAFAVLRSSITERECWLDHVFPCDRRSHIEMIECRDPTYSPFSLLSVIRQYGLSPIVEAGSSHQTESAQHSRLEMEWAEWEVELASADTWAQTEE